MTSSTRTNADEPRPENSVFISWAGDTGHRVAETVRAWLHDILAPTAKPWLSSQAIQVGDRWLEKVTTEAQVAKVCVLCLTRETPQSTWMAFEAGLAHGNPDCLLCPVQFFDPPSDLGPLGHFQFKPASREGMLAMLDAIVGHLGFSDPVFHQRAEKSWPVFEETILTIEQESKAPSAAFPNHPLRLAPELEKRERDLPDSNAILQASTEIDLLALTYNSLAGAIDSFQFPHLAKATIRIYAAPNQRHSHPNHQGNYPALRTEWERSLEQIVAALCDRDRCPKLRTIEIVLLSTSPDFTGTIARWRHGSGQGTRLRMTICVNGVEMKDLPTFVVDTEGREENPAFSRFHAMFQLTGSKPASPLYFTVDSERMTSRHRREFISKLSEVSNHPDIPDSRDSRFALSINPRNPHLTPSSEPLKPREVAGYFEPPLVAGENGAQWTIIEGADSGTMELECHLPLCARMRRRHFLANFVVLILQSQEGPLVALVDHQKGRWDKDVPGGKYSERDRTHEDCLVREVFEELGWILDRTQFQDPVGLIYEEHALHENGDPGIIQYYHYVLDPDRDWPGNRDRPGRSTKRHPIQYEPLDRLIESKRRLLAKDDSVEPICHVPMRVLERIREIIREA